MKNSLKIFASLCLSSSLSTAEVAKPLLSNSVPKFEVAGEKEPKSLVPYKDFSACSDEKRIEKSTKDFEKLVQGFKSKQQEVALFRNDPDSRSANSVTYKLNGQKLKPGAFIYLWVPPDLEEQGTNFVILGHRQNPATTTGMTPGKKWDEKPGLTSVQVYDPSRSDKERWRHWAGDSSGGQGAKFAETDIRFEMENLYQWSKLGHRGVQAGDFKNDLLKGSVVRLTNVGQDEVEISELIYKTNLAPGSEQVTQVFTEGTKFGNSATGEGYQIGGGQANQGLFPGAIELGRKSKGQPKLPSGWIYKNGQLMIPLPKGKVLAGVELSAGDSHPDQIINSDGGHGTKGWARLNMELVRGGSVVDTLMSNENVPPEGILMGAPSQCKQETKDGDYLVLTSKADTTYLGGIRIHFKD